MNFNYGKGIIEIPDSDIPEWANWIAADWAGDVYCYERKPRAISSEFIDESRFVRVAGICGYVERWQTTLVKLDREEGKLVGRFDLRRHCSKNYPYARRCGWAYKAWLRAMRDYFGRPQSIPNQAQLFGGEQ